MDKSTFTLLTIRISYIILIGKEVKSMSCKKKKNTATATAVVRKEFSFYTSEEVLNEILGDVAAEGVTIVAFTITKVDKRNKKSKKSVYFARLIFGPDSSNSSFANKVAREALQSAGVQFNEKKVIQLIVAPAPGVALRVFQALENVEVFATYSAVNSIILNVADIKAALKALKKSGIIS
jgi:hypothetical protein